MKVFNRNSALALIVSIFATSPSVMATAAPLDVIGSTFTVARGSHSTPGNTDPQPVQIAPSEKAKISRFGTCRNVVNTTKTTSIMVPVRDNSEWTSGEGSFLAEPREGTALTPCKPKPYFSRGIRYYPSWASAISDDKAQFATNTWLSPDGNRMAITGYLGTYFFDIRDDGSAVLTDKFDARTIPGSTVNNRMGPNYITQVSKSGDRLKNFYGDIYAKHGASWVLEKLSPARWKTYGYEVNSVMSPAGDFVVYRYVNSTRRNAPTYFEVWMRSGTTWSKVTDIPMRHSSYTTFQSMAVDEAGHFYFLNSSSTAVTVGVYDYDVSTQSFSFDTEFNVDPNAQIITGWFSTMKVSADGSRLTLLGLKTVTYEKTAAGSWTEASLQDYASLGIQPVKADISWGLNNAWESASETIVMSADGSLMWGIGPGGGKGAIVQLEFDDASSKWVNKGTIYPADYDAVRNSSTYYSSSWFDMFTIPAPNLAVSDDGSRILLGSPMDTARGATYVTKYVKLAVGSAYLFDQN